MTSAPGQEFTLVPAESDYYRMWIFLNRLGLKPYELDKISHEDKLVLWKFIEYENEKAKHDSFKTQSRNAHK
jgi:hypothetical protein